MSMPSDRPYSRESSALRRLLAADDTSPPATHVYGDGDIVDRVLSTFPDAV